MVKNKALPDSAAPPRLLSLSLPRRLGPTKAGLMCLLSLIDAVHPEGTPWILLGLDPGTMLHQIQTPLLALKSSAVWAQSLCSLVLTMHLILQTGRCPSVPCECQPHAHLGDTAGGDLFPVGVSLPPSTFQPW